MIGTPELTIDELIGSSRLPRVPWPRKAQATITVTDQHGLQAAIDKAKAGDVISLVGPRFDGFKIDHTWGRNLREVWTPHPREAQVVSIINGNQDGSQPLIEGFAVWDMNAGSELWVAGCGVKPGEWQEPADTEHGEVGDEHGLVWRSGPYCFGTFITGMNGAIRMKDCTFYDADHSTGYGGGGLKAVARLCTMGLHLENCRTADGIIIQEQVGYEDNAAFFILQGNDFGACGRSHVQCGTRSDFQHPLAFLGVLIQNNKFRDGYCGSANAGCLSFHGYPGLCIIKDNLIESNGWDGLIPKQQKDGTWLDVQTHLDPTAGIVFWQNFQWGGAIFDQDHWPTSVAVLDNNKIKIGPGKLDACTIEFVKKAHFRNLDTTGSAPGAHWVSIPGQFAPTGVSDLKLYGPPFPPIREHIGDYTQKTWRVWGPSDFAKHAVPSGGPT